MFYCDKCGSADCCERTDLVNEPVLCDACYALEKIPSQSDCDNCWFYNRQLEQCDKVGGCRYDS